MNAGDNTHLTFWGKTRQPGTGRSEWHPVAYHSLDVAAAAFVLLSLGAVPLTRTSTPSGPRRSFR